MARDVIGYHNLLHHENGTVLLSRKRILNLPYTIYFAKHSCFVEAINNEIQQYTSNGLIARWARIYKGDEFSSFNDVNVPKQLSMKQISGICVICLILYAISLFVYINELLSKKCRFIQKLFEYL